MLDLAAQNPAEVAELAEQQELLGRLLAELPEDRRRALQAEAETRGSTASDVVRMHLERYAEIVWRALTGPGPNGTSF